jgi:hypothetical protein
MTSVKELGWVVIGTAAAVGLGCSDRSGIVTVSSRSKPTPREGNLIHRWRQHRTAAAEGRPGRVLIGLEMIPAAWFGTGRIHA